MDKVITFIQSIGIKVIKVDVIQHTFIDGVKIVNGCIHITENTKVSNLLHEAGHLAIIPANLRHLADGDLDDAFKKIFEITSKLPHDHPIQRVLIQCSDVEATAWAWSVGCHLGIPHSEIIDEEDYEGEGGNIRFMLSCGKYFGINGLAASGMTTTRTYPRLEYWAQPAIEY